ncbi:ATP-dependent nuclease [Cobetia crustatorum]|uniref:ATP-dependent nuclease n=1 Tax=Cobetia crustatorum TaxID=553385 RepID=UPI000467FBA6|nr:AAA family ATPase [Cobetia crustatorum]
MEIIKSIQVRRFRSLKSVTRNISFTHLNILVGQNDQGKSNMLRALNLFFNNQTDANSKFRFEDDYCYHSNTGKGTSREIRIDLVIDPPVGRFKNAQPLRWTKRWKLDGSVIEERKYIESGNDLSQRDNVYKWLDKIRYRYVPAIKGQDYFSSLMGELHDVLNEAHSEVLNTQGEEFISGIQGVTESITQELNDQIGISNTIQVPSDFRQLFSNLDFGTRIDGYTYHLKQRGDGIKIRHIPIILKYMSEKERNVSRAGYVKPDTIWGFEEPENNLELKYAFELAETFKKYSKDIQIIMTTHSPAFYALDVGPDDGVNTFHIKQSEDKCTSLTKVTSMQTDDLHEEMGLLPIITPYLTKLYEHQKEISELKENLSELSQNIKCVVLTEDENHDHVKSFFSANGFIETDTEYQSYFGASQIKGAIMVGRYLLSTNPDVKVVIHRDRDYLNEQELDSLRNSIEKHNINFFVTDGVDVESHYLDVNHLVGLYPEISHEDMVMFIQEATDECREASIDRLINYDLSQTKPRSNAYSNRIRELNLMYDENVNRYRYGKRVLGVLQSKIQRRIRMNPDLMQASPHITCASLNDIFLDVWG